MKKKHTAQSAFANLCIFLGIFVFFGGLLLALLATPNPQPLAGERARNPGEGLHSAKELSIAPAGGVYPAWIATYNGPGNYIDEATAIAVDGSGNVYVTGQSFGVGVDFDYATVKYNADGQEQWVARYNGPVNFDDHATAIAVDSSGNVYVTGRSPGLGTGDDYVTIKYDSTGQQQWLARYNGPGSDGNLTDAAWTIVPIVNTDGNANTDTNGNAESESNGNSNSDRDCYSNIYVYTDAYLRPR